MMTDGTKAQVWAAVWQAWGGSYAITGPQANDMRFPGQWFQLESGLHYNWHRHYDPSIGRYTQPDPLGFVDGPSVFGYAKGLPQVLVDFKGLQSNQSLWDKLGRNVCPIIPDAPGDCTPGLEFKLQEEVNSSCKTKRICPTLFNIPTLSKEKMTEHMELNRKCGLARDKINNTCYRGGDKKHRDAGIDAWASFAECARLLGL